MKSEKELVRDEVSCEFTARDLAEIDALVEQQNALCFEFLRQSEEAEINPRPVPHVHTPHDEKAALSRLSFALATLGGLTVALALTLGVISKLLLAALLAFTGFLVSEWLVKLGIAALWDRKYFLEHFSRLYVPPLVLFLLSASVVLLGRVAGLDLAETLIKLGTWAWWGLETSLLLLGALSFVAWKRFGWSGVLLRNYQRCESRIGFLKLRIGIRKQEVSVAVLVLLLMLTGVQASAQCLQVALDRTGSIADQAQVERRLVDALLDNADHISCVSLLLFADHALNARPELITRVSAFGELPLININTKLELWKRDLRSHLVAVLGTPLIPARCTSLADMTVVVARGRWLLISDGVHDCPRPRVAGPWADGEESTVVLVRSLNDRGNDVDQFELRAKQLRQYLPKARVVPGVLLEEAVGRHAVSPVPKAQLLPTAARPF